jgi:hypothetical protein
MLLAWLVGLVTYQLINPGAAGYWSDFWTTIAQHLHTTSHAWLSASVTAFIVSVLVAFPFAQVSKDSKVPQAAPVPPALEVSDV